LRNPYDCDSDEELKVNQIVSGSVKDNKNSSNKSTSSDEDTFSFSIESEDEHHENSMLLDNTKQSQYGAFNKDQHNSSRASIKKYPKTGLLLTTLNILKSYFGVGILAIPFGF